MGGQLDQTCLLLRPTNRHAAAIVMDPMNESRRCPDPSGTSFVLRIAFDQPSKSPGILASFGRIPAINDIVLKGSTYGKIQCYLTVHSKTGEILLHDKSQRRTTHLTDFTGARHWKKTPKRGVIPRRGNKILHLDIGKAFFELLLAPNLDGSFRRSSLDFVKRNPDEDPFADTSSMEQFAVIPQEHDTRVRAQPEEEIFHLDVRPLGEGSFGQVTEVVDLYTGDHYAAKSIPWADNVKHYFPTEGLERKGFIRSKATPELVTRTKLFNLFLKGI